MGSETGKITVVMIKDAYRMRDGVLLRGDTIEDLRVDVVRWQKMVTTPPLDEMIDWLAQQAQQKAQSHEVAGDGASTDAQTKRAKSKLVVPEQREPAPIAPVPAMPLAERQPNGIQKGFRYNMHAIAWGPEHKGGLDVQGTNVHFGRYGSAMIGVRHLLDIGSPRYGDAILVTRHAESGIGTLLRLPVVEDLGRAFRMELKRAAQHDNGTELDPSGKRVPYIHHYAEDSPHCPYAYETHRFAKTLAGMDIRSAELSASLFLIAGRSDHALADSMPASAQTFIGAAQCIGMYLEQVRMVRLSREDNSIPPLTFDPSEGVLRAGECEVVRLGQPTRVDEGAVMAAIDTIVKRMDENRFGIPARSLAMRYAVPIAVGLWAHDPAALKDRLAWLTNEVAHLRGEERIEALAEIYRTWHGMLPVLTDKAGGMNEAPQGSGGNESLEGPSAGDLSATSAPIPDVTLMPVPAPQPPVVPPVITNGALLHRMSSITSLRVF